MARHEPTVETVEARIADALDAHHALHRKHGTQTARDHDAAQAGKPAKNA